MRSRALFNCGQNLHDLPLMSLAERERERRNNIELYLEDGTVPEDDEKDAKQADTDSEKESWWGFAKECVSLLLK